MRLLCVSLARKASLVAAAAHDGFVKLAASKELHALIRLLVPRAQLVKVPGGHTSGHALARWLLVDLVLRSIDMLDRDLGRSGRWETTLRARL